MLQAGKLCADVAKGSVWQIAANRSVVSYLELCEEANASELSLGNARVLQLLTGGVEWLATLLESTGPNEKLERRAKATRLLGSKTRNCALPL